MELVPDRENVSAKLQARLGLGAPPGEEAARADVEGWGSSGLRMAFGSSPWGKKASFLELGPQGGMAGTPLVFSWNKTVEVCLVETWVENGRPGTAFRLSVWGGLRPTFSKLAWAVCLLTPRNARVAAAHSPSDIYCPFPHPVPRGCGWRGHPGRTDHASGPQKQHGRRVGQGRQPGEQPGLEGRCGAHGEYGGGHSVGR